jgi:serine O-acetyltransferase
MQKGNSFSLEICSEFPNGEFSFGTFVKYFMYSPKFRLMLNYRLGKRFYRSKLFIVRQLGLYLRTKMIVKRHCDFSYNAQIGLNLKLPHPLGIVIGDGVVIRDSVKIFQQVTLGSHGKSGEELKYPVIESGVKIFAGAKIIGGITIGENAIIGANAVVNIDVPPNSTAVGIPCKIVSKK